jgi:hypothetical protein
MSFPPPITSLKLRVSTGTDTYEQPIPSASLGNNTMQIMPNTIVFNAFINNPVGTIFTPSIVTSYGSDQLGNAVSAVSTPSVVANFIARKTTPNLSLASITNKLTTASPFSLSVSSLSGGALTYSSSAAGVATVNSTGLVTLVGAGTTTITVSQAASLDGVYAAAGPVSTQLVVSMPAAPIQRGFSVLTDNSDFTGLDFDSGMTTLFANKDEIVSPITMPNSNFMFNNAAYAILYAGSNGWFSFGTNVSEIGYGANNQQPTNTFRYFSSDYVSTGSYKFVENNTRLLFKLTGYVFSVTTKTFTINVIIEQSGEIRTNYTLASTFTSNAVTIGFVGDNSSGTSDDIFLNFSDVTFNGTTALNPFSLLNGKTILFIPANYPSFGLFTLPADIQVYKNQPITRVLTPPTSNSLGAFTFTSSNTAVATITVNDGVSSINVIGAGTTTITATQAASGDYASASTSVSLTVAALLPIFGPFNLPAGELVYQNQPITRVLTPPTSHSLGEFTFTSSNSAVATISVNNGESSINVIGAGSTTIEVVQAASGDYASLFITFLLNTVTGTLLRTTWNQKGGDIDGEAANDQSGSIVSLSADGTIVAIGAYGNSGAGSDAGHVRVYHWTGSSWDQRGLDIDGEAAGDHTGYSISLSSDGNTVAIGAPGNSNIINGISYNGRVRVYDWNTAVAPNGWSQRGSDIDGEAAGDLSGTSVSLSSDGNTLAIGAYGNSSTGSNAGHVRVYDWNGLSWVQRGLGIDGKVAGDLSGYSVSLSSNGNTVAIGAPNNDNGAGSNAGRVCVYDWTGLSWVQRGSDIVGEAANDQSGWSVSLSSAGNTVAIGAPYNSSAGSDAGHVRVYDWTGSSWAQRGQDIDGEAANDYSGYSVSLSSGGNTVAIGAPNNSGAGSYAGHVCVYDWNTSVAPNRWRLRGLDIDGEAPYDQSGYSVSLSSDGNTVAIGAPFNDGTGSNAGHVRVFKYE